MSHNSQQETDKKYYQQHHQHYRNHLRQQQHQNQQQQQQQPPQQHISEETMPTSQSEARLVVDERESIAENVSQSQSVDENDASHAQTQQLPSPSNSNQRPLQKDCRVMRCFCGCTQLSFGQIESISMMNVTGLVSNPLGNNLLKTFLKIGHRTDKSNALLLLECYELCDRILNDLDSFRDHLDNLIEVCPSYVWEQQLNDASDANDEDANDQMANVLSALKKECLNGIDCDSDFSRFRKELLRKIGKHC